MTDARLTVKTYEIREEEFKQKLGLEYDELRSMTQSVDEEGHKIVLIEASSGKLHSPTKSQRGGY